VAGNAQFRRLPFISAEEAFGRVAGRRNVCWLDSSLERTGDGEYSILACDPRWTFTAKNDRWQVHREEGSAEAGDVGALPELEAWLSQQRAVLPETKSDLPFVGGAIGWLSYDLGRQFEQINGAAADDLNTLDIWLAWFDAAVVWDHRSAAVWLVGIGDERGGRAMAALEATLAQPPSKVALADVDGTKTAKSDLSRAQYVERVERVREGIAQGEYYQLNLVQRFECAQREAPETTYLRLRKINAAPFSAFIAGDGWTVMSSSPERFLEVSPTGQIRTCPIKGTRPRGVTKSEDVTRSAELVANAKERAELLMIVDLLRNDLGRVCEPGSVRVPRLYALETYATVHHLVGEVQGQLRGGITRAALLRAVFPGGSITGAPKVSAMHAIDEFEPHRRGIAMGAIGYFSAHGRVDLNIAIRTIVCRNHQAYVSVGAGIVWDSVPELEYEETLTKARALFDALGVTRIEA
jgi:para-aminobenzoate synthetase component I